MIRILLALAIGGAVIATYLALLATWSIAHDDTLSRPGKVGRVVLAWLLPIIGPVIQLMSAAELAPESLPTSMVTWPVRWLWTPSRPARGDSGPGDAAGLDYGSAGSGDNASGHH